MDCADLFRVRMSSSSIIDTSKKYYGGLSDSTHILVEDKPMFMVTPVNLWRCLSCSLSSFPWTTTASAMPITWLQQVRIWSIIHWKMSCAQAGPKGGRQIWTFPMVYWRSWAVITHSCRLCTGRMRFHLAWWIRCFSQFLGDLFQCRGFVMIMFSSCIKILWVQTDS